MISLHGQTNRGELTLTFDLDLDGGVTYAGGPNGAGKTTLLRVVAGLEALDEGELRIADQVVDSPARGIFVPAHERAVAMAFQDHRLFPHLCAIDNVAFPARRRGESKAVALHEAEGHLASVGMTELAQRKPVELSIGQQQRAALARALATPAEVLLLDEPLASVDEASRAVIRERLRSTSHKATIWVTHDQDDVLPDSTLISFDNGFVRKTRSP